MGTFSGRVGRYRLFFVRSTCPGGVVRDLVFFFGVVFLGAIRGLEFLPTGALARWGGPGTWGILSPPRGVRMGRPSLGHVFATVGVRGEKGRDESKRHRAESQWIVAARPLCHLQYPVAYLSRLQRILPAAR